MRAAGETDGARCCVSSWRPAALLDMFSFRLVGSASRTPLRTKTRSGKTSLPSWRTSSQSRWGAVLRDGLRLPPQACTRDAWPLMLQLSPRPLSPKTMPADERASPLTRLKALYPSNRKQAPTSLSSLVDAVCRRGCATGAGPWRWSRQSDCDCHHSDTATCACSQRTAAAD